MTHAFLEVHTHEDVVRLVLDRGPPREIVFIGSTSSLVWQGLLVHAPTRVAMNCPMSREDALKEGVGCQDWDRCSC